MLIQLAQAGEFVAPTIAWSILTPLLIVFGGGVLGVLLEAFVPDANRRLVQIVLALVTQVAAFVSLFWVGSLLSADPTQALALPVGTGLIYDNWTLVIQGIILLCSLLSTLVMMDRTSAKADAFAPTASAIPNSSASITSRVLNVLIWLSNSIPASKDSHPADMCLLA